MGTVIDMHKCDDCGKHARHTVKSGGVIIMRLCDVCVEKHPLSGG